MLQYDQLINSFIDIIPEHFRVYIIDKALNRHLSIDFIIHRPCTLSNFIGKNIHEINYNSKFDVPLKS